MDPLSMSLQTTLDLANWTLSDLYGSLVSQESQISIMKNQVGGPLALVGKASKGSLERMIENKLTEGKGEKENGLGGRK